VIADLDHFDKAEQFSLMFLAAWFRIERMKTPPIHLLSALAWLSVVAGVPPAVADPQSGRILDATGALRNVGLKNRIEPKLKAHFPSIPAENFSRAP